MLSHPCCSLKNTTLSLIQLSGSIVPRLILRGEIPIALSIVLLTRVFFSCICLLLVLSVRSQTPLYPPAPKIDFSSIGGTKSQSKAQTKELNKERRERMKEIRGMKKDMRKKTGWSKDSVNQYGDYMSRMKPKEFQSFKGKYQQQSAKGEANEKSAAMKDEQKARAAAVKGKYTGKFASARGKMKVPRDSLGNRINRDQLADSLQRPTLDSTAAGGMAKEVQAMGEENLSGFLKGYQAKNAPTSESLVADMTQSFNPGAGPAQVTPYISKFETFKDRRPKEVDEKKMGEGMAEAQARQKVEEKKNMVKNLVNQKNASFQEKSTIQRFQVGGYIQYQFVPQALDIAPTVGFQLTSRMTMGVGYNKRILFDAPDSASVVGKRMFIQYDLIGSIFFHGESEWLQQEKGELGMIYERNTQIGLGTKVKMGRFDGTLTALYNLNPASTLQTSRFSFRYGINLL